MRLNVALVRLVCFVLVAIGQAVGAPVITGFSPKAGAPGDQIQLVGSGFLSGGNITVRFWNGGSGVAAGGSIQSDTIINVFVPNGVTTGPISIQQDSNQPSFTTDDFLVVGLGPYISGFFPPFGQPNDTVVINGVHLGNTLAVSFNGTSTFEFTPNADGTQITTRVPLNATNGPITVSTIFGTSNSPSAFTVLGPGPYVTGFLPTAGDSGTKVTINGLHFTGVTNVSFNGSPASIVSANSDTLIQVLAPVGVTSGPITVKTALGSAITDSNFFGKPTIRSVTPLVGRANTNVVIVGTNFLGTAAVSFNGVAATNFAVLNNSNLTVVVPVDAITGLIRVVTPQGSAFSPSNFVVQPSISSLSPGFGPVGASVTIKGANLNVGIPIIKFNGVQAAPPTSITFSQLVVKVPAGTSSGPVTLSTTNGADTSPTPFYLPATISSLSATNSAPGSRVTVLGQNFLGASRVGFNGTPSADFTVTNNTTIGVTVPPDFVTGPIFVTTPAGVVSSTNIFYGAPVISGFSPSHGLPGTNVTINGRNFLGGNVQFNGVNASLLSLNNTQMVATVPTGAQTGPITTSGPAGISSSSGNFVLDYPTNAPLLSIGHATNLLTISWSATLTNYLLQYQDAFSATSDWRSFPTLPIPAGSLLYITDTNNGSGRFYRLHQ